MAGSEERKWVAGRGERWDPCATAKEFAISYTTDTEYAIIRYTMQVNGIPLSSHLVEVSKL